jgi:hypothetical protein
MISPTCYVLRTFVPVHILESCLLFIVTFLNVVYLLRFDRQVKSEEPFQSESLR